jgi:hypothetical protein
MNYHLRVELGYANDLPYEVLSERVHPVYKDFEGRSILPAQRSTPRLHRAPRTLRLRMKTGQSTRQPRTRRRVHCRRPYCGLISASP